MTTAHHFTRFSCVVGKRRISYDTLTREYRCNDCGGRLVVMWRDGDWRAECGVCGGIDFAHEYQIQREESDALEVLAGLPPEVAAALE